MENMEISAMTYQLGHREILILLEIFNGVSLHVILSAWKIEDNSILDPGFTRWGP